MRIRPHTETTITRPTESEADRRHIRVLFSEDAESFDFGRGCQDFEVEMATLLDRHVPTHLETAVALQTQASMDRSGSNSSRA